VARRVTESVGAPTIGIAAGLGTDGQVLVSTDLLGQLPEPPPFVTPKADVRGAVIAAGRAFADEVRAAE
jgi:3-methyl-2-oxobutanoate hydroxymethyltransferase